MDVIGFVIGGSIIGFCAAACIVEFLWKRCSCQYVKRSDQESQLDNLETFVYINNSRYNPGLNPHFAAVCMETLPTYPVTSL